MSSPVIRWVEARRLRTDLPHLPIGATVELNYRIREGEKERVQSFQGVVIRKHGGEGSLNSTFTVRKVTQGYGVERIIPYHSPRIESIKILREGKVRRAKLYFLRELKGKKSRLRDKSNV